MAHLVVGTAGHIDHGKSSLVLALTGTDPDRLPEEQRRKITIDLGYAFLNDEIAFIDVPGHEKFIRNMVAGASTTDFAVLVVAADDGVMPQTTEHLHILRLLGVRAGCVVITKIDIAEPAWIDLVEEQILEAVEGTFLDHCDIFRIDSLSRKGVDPFRDYLISTLSTMTPRQDQGVFRLPVDRVFSLKGHGTVTTGTVLSGSLKKDARLVILPGKNSARVKHVESHGHESEFLVPGQRAAVNLIGDVKQLVRGNTLAEPDSLFVTTRVRLAVELLKDRAELADRQRLRFLIGTDEVLGRIQIIQTENRVCFANLLLEKPVVAAWGDRFVIRRYSPMETLGGGLVLEPDAPRFRAADKSSEIAICRGLSTASLNEALKCFLTSRAKYGLSLLYIAQCFGIPVSRVLDAVTDLDTVVTHDTVILSEHFEPCKNAVLAEVDSHHQQHPEQQGISPSEFRNEQIRRYADPVLLFAIESLVQAGALVKRSGVLSRAEQKFTPSDKQQKVMDSISALLKRDAFTPPLSTVIAEQLSLAKQDIEKSLVLMERMGLARRLGVDLFFDSACFNAAVVSVCKALNTSDGLSVSDVSKLLNSSRKYIVPFLEYLDKEGFTLRNDNLRVKGPNFNKMSKN